MKKAVFILLSVVVFNFSFGQKQKVLGEIHGLSLVEVKGKLGVVNDKGEFKVSLGDYTDIKFDKKNWVYKCYKGKKTFEIISEDNQKVQSKSLFTAILRTYDQGMYEVKSVKGVGLIKNWKIVIPAIHDKITEGIDLNLGVVTYEVEKDGLKGLYYNDSLILKPEYDDFSKVDDYSNELLVIKKDKKGVVNIVEGSLKKEIVLPIIYEEITFIHDLEDNHLYKTRLNKLWGVYNPQLRKQITLNSFQALEWKKHKNIFESYIVEVKQNNQQKYLITDLKNDSLLILSDEIIYFENKEVVAIKNKDGKYQLVQLSDYLKLDPVSYQEIIAIDQFSYAVELNNKWGMVTETGSELIEIKFATFEGLKQEFKNHY